MNEAQTKKQIIFESYNLLLLLVLLTAYNVHQDRIKLRMVRMISNHFLF